MFEAINQAIAQHQLHPIINKAFPFTEVHKADRYLKSIAHCGKVVIEIK
ncbi:MAG: zinc-binding dehydrogenase [Nostoc sp.]